MEEFYHDAEFTASSLLKIGNLTYVDFQALLRKVVKLEPGKDLTRSNNTTFH